MSFENAASVLAQFAGAAETLGSTTLSLSDLVTSGASGMQAASVALSAAGGTVPTATPINAAVAINSNASATIGDSSNVLVAADALTHRSRSVGRYAHLAHCFCCLGCILCLFGARISLPF